MYTHNKHTHTNNCIHTIEKKYTNIPMCVNMCMNMHRDLREKHTRLLSATHCNTLQHPATPCNTKIPLRHACCCYLQHTATHCNTLQQTATHCNTLQHTAIHWNTLQHTATHYYLWETHVVVIKGIQNHKEWLPIWHDPVYLLWHTVTQCDTVQRAATHYNALPLVRNACRCYQGYTES